MSAAHADQLVVIAVTEANAARVGSELVEVIGALSRASDLPNLYPPVQSVAWDSGADGEYHTTAWVITWRRTARAAGFLTERVDGGRS